ncbi:tRNA (adenosine(37)-N6)-threonylcarbamoyltransferase complex transferase subunit TsaD [Legionella spiritensis]|uniref:tRNA N6-adenosine threonylcarbamoyltransferase n=1 Tax=Legionella spiritensis TaxID=452 RepID=A0A0W0ZAY9_LEGSP|nr:tRNA (adenosine(37)-N6)-threonylcarbamoyltransferase complex transferase subunit TsaD [Legionella spiritensis]KTD65926.1 DNA-binding/iron metalloprotein/AP endonuclease [Legionella spiritensis]SNV31792.1 O-sialoglycoprotein endopeptidase [Legionella spiritensis]
MLVLGIESSCDETGIALYDSYRGLVGHALHSQITTHRLYGGVVPELASRDHVNYLIPLLDDVLEQAGLHTSAIDGIAYTAGPGLIGALLTGACLAKSLAFSLDRPSLAIHHLEAHILAAMLDTPELDFPFLALLVSGGHTQLIEARGLGDYRLLGDTLDDAVGEAFDKTAKLMGIPYPGGAGLAELADQCPVSVRRHFSPFPRPMTDRPGLDFSFSGLKTHAMTTWNNSTRDHEAKMAIAHAFQQAIIDTLLIKCRRAVEKTAIDRLVVAGGVGANRALRDSLFAMMEETRGEVYFPRAEYCTDNGAMIAFAGFLHFQAGRADSGHAIDVKARWPLA